MKVDARQHSATIISTIGIIFGVIAVLASLAYALGCFVIPSLSGLSGANAASHEASPWANPGTYWAFAGAFLPVILGGLSSLLHRRGEDDHGNLPAVAVMLGVVATLIVFVATLYYTGQVDVFNSRR